MDEDDEAQEVLVIDRDELHYAREAAEANGVAVEELEQPGLDPATTATLLLTGSSLGIATVVGLVDLRKGGHVVDLRSGVERSHYRSPEVIYGLVVIRADDGTVSVEIKEPRGMFGEVVDALKGVLTGLEEAGMAEIGKKVEAALGHSADVTTTPLQR